jgi:hypothetical protein
VCGYTASDAATEFFFDEVRASPGVRQPIPTVLSRRQAWLNASAQGSSSVDYHTPEEKKIVESVPAWFLADPVQAAPLPAAQPFQLLGLPTTWPVILAPGEALRFLVRFAPQHDGAASGALSIISNDVDHDVVDVRLQGQGVNWPPATPTPACPGWIHSDINQDCVVDEADVMLLMRRWQQHFQ